MDSLWTPVWAKTRKQNKTYPWQLVFHVFEKDGSDIVDLWHDKVKKETENDNLGYYSGVNAGSYTMLSIHVALGTDIKLKDEYKRIVNELRKMRIKNFLPQILENGYGGKKRITGDFSSEDIERMRKELEDELEKVKVELENEVKESKKELTLVLEKLVKREVDELIQNELKKLPQYLENVTGAGWPKYLKIPLRFAFAGVFIFGMICGRLLPF